MNSLTFQDKSFKFKINLNLRAIFLNPSLGRIWKTAARAWLETAIPLVFGKEMDDRFQMADTSDTGIGHFV